MYVLVDPRSGKDEVRVVVIVLGGDPGPKI